jgi:hypothetical protein
MVRRRAKKMIAMMMPYLRRVASAPCSLIGRNGRSARIGLPMIERPLRGGQESWWGVGAIHSSCCGAPQQQKFHLLDISGGAHRLLHCSFSIPSATQLSPR